MRLTVLVVPRCSVKHPPVLSATGEQRASGVSVGKGRVPNKVLLPKKHVKIHFCDSAVAAGSAEKVRLPQRPEKLLHGWVPRWPDPAGAERARLRRAAGTAPP